MLHRSVVVTACYDGAIRAYDSHGSPIATVTAHKKAVKCTAVTGGAEEGAPCHVLSGAKDGVVKLWTLSDGAFAQKATCIGHAGGVESVAFAPGGTQVRGALCVCCVCVCSGLALTPAVLSSSLAIVAQFCSGSWDGIVNVWSAAGAGDGDESKDESGPRKRARTGQATSSSAVKTLVRVATRAVPPTPSMWHVNALSSWRTRVACAGTVRAAEGPCSCGELSGVAGAQHDCVGVAGSFNSPVGPHRWRACGVHGHGMLCAHARRVCTWVTRTYLRGVLLSPVCTCRLPPLPQHGNKVVNSVSTAANGVTFASAHPDHIVRVWDSRASGVIAWNRHRHARAVCDIAGCCGRHFCRKAGAARPHGLGFQRCVAARIVQRAGELVVRRVASRVGHPVQHTTAQARGPR